MTHREAQKFVDSWLQTWKTTTSNVSHLADDVVVTSPLAR
jgi:hypothetical protein